VMEIFAMDISSLRVQVSAAHLQGRLSPPIPAIPHHSRVIE
jgi:hypothetical protein